MCWYSVGNMVAYFNNHSLRRHMYFFVWMHSLFTTVATFSVSSVVEENKAGRKDYTGIRSESLSLPLYHFTIYRRLTLRRLKPAGDFYRAVAQRKIIKVSV